MVHEDEIDEIADFLQNDPQMKILHLCKGTWAAAWYFEK